MKLKTKITISINQFENIRPQIEIDTDKLEDSVALVQKLHEAFHGLFDEDKVKQHQAWILEAIEQGKEFSVVDWQKYIEPFPKVAYQANEIKKRVKREQSKVAREIKSQDDEVMAIGSEPIPNDSM